MKSRFILACCMVVLTLGLFTGCNQNPDANNGGEGDSPSKTEEGQSKKDDDKMIIGITQNNVNTDTYQQTYDKVFKEEAKKLEEEGFESIILDAKGDVATQTKQVNELIEKKADVIIVWPTNGEAIVPALKKAKDAGVPVIITNSMVSEEGKQYIKAFSGPDNVEEGRLAAELLIEALGGKGKAQGKVVEIKGLTGYTTAIERSDGFHEVIKGEEGIEVVESLPGDWNREKAKEVMADFLSRYEEIDGVYAADDNMGVGALAAIKEAGREIMPIVGATNFADGYEAMEKGEYYGSVYQSPKEDARNAIATAVKIIKGEEVEFNNYFETPKIHKGNLSDFEKPVF